MIAAWRFVQHAGYRLADRLNNFNVGSFVVVAIAATIVGDTAYELLTGALWPVDFWYGLWRLALFVVSTGGLWPFVLMVRRWLASQHERLAIDAVHDIDSLPALIVFVSLRNTSHESAVWHHLRPDDPKRGRLRYVRLIPSEYTVEIAKKYRDRIEKEHGLTARVHDPADFYDAHSVYEKTLSAISHTHQDLPDLASAAEIAIDVTGGTAIASIGASLAGSRVGATLQYIVPLVDGQRQIWAKEVVKFKRVDVSWHRSPHDASTGKLDDTPATETAHA